MGYHFSQEERQVGRTGAEGLEDSNGLLEKFPGKRSAMWCGGTGLRFCHP